MKDKTECAADTEELVLPEIEKYLSRKTFPEMELPKIFNHEDHLVIFDIGACEGEDSIRYSSLFPNARIFTFEPLPENQTLVQRNFQRYGIQNAFLQSVALSDKEGESQFYVSTGKPPELWEGEKWNYGNKSSSLLEPGLVKDRFEWLEFCRSIPVKCSTLENFSKENKLKHIDFIHLDVQGAEMLVLKGAGSLISNITAIWLEVTQEELYQRQALKTDLEQFLSRSGFTKTHEELSGYQSDQFWVNAQNEIGKKYINQSQSSKNMQSGGFHIYLSKIKKRLFSSSKPASISVDSHAKDQSRKMLEFYRQEISSGSCLVFDVGANMGNRSKVFRQLGWNVVAVDPQKNCCAALSESFAGDAGVKIINKALGEKPGLAKMYVSSADVLSSLSKEFIEKTSQSGRFQQDWWNNEVEVEVTTLDRLIAEHGKPKFIKIDVEGFELQVVKGLSQSVEMISLEYTPELTSNLKAAIEHLETLANYEFNLSWCESMVMSRAKWFGKEKLFQLMDSMVDEMYLFGDIYIKRK